MKNGHHLWQVFTFDAVQFKVRSRKSCGQFERDPVRIELGSEVFLIEHVRAGFDVKIPELFRQEAILINIRSPSTVLVGFLSGGLTLSPEIRRHVLTLRKEEITANNVNKAVE